MTYRVVGTNKKSGARMSLEIEASSEGEARSIAQGRGLSVHSVQPAGGKSSTNEHSATRIIPPLPGQSF